MTVICQPEKGAVHFIGIGGAGMSGLARLFLGAGAEVTGSDLQDSEATRSLQAMGARICIGHRVENLNGARRVVYTAAVKPDNPELVEARRRQIQTISRAELLAEVMEGRRGIAIAGTHGKTTTTAMAAAIFTAAGADPTVLIGGDWGPFGGNARSGSGPHFIAEACEAFDSFLDLHPDLAVVTNIEPDHLDWHGSEEGVINAFRRFLSQTHADGCAVLCGDDPRVRQASDAAPCRTVTFGVDPAAVYRAVDLDLQSSRPTFSVTQRGERLGTVRLGVPGRHNVMNALAAIAAARECGLPIEAVQDSLGEFSGVGRRFERLGTVAGVTVVDDYAHHPTEVLATLAAARTSTGGRVMAVFQPHLFSRTQLLMHDFSRAFADADVVVIADIYPAREAPIRGVDGAALAAAILAATPGKTVVHISPKEAITGWLRSRLQPEDWVLVMGAGDIRPVGEELLSLMRGEAKNG